MNASTICRAFGRWSRAAAFGVALALGASASHAQMGGFGGANYRSPLSRGEVERMIETLGLDESQAGLVQSLYQGFNESYESASEGARERVREAFQAMRDSGQWQGAASTGINSGREWQKQSQALVQSFFNDVQTVLSEDQQAKWERYQREWRRRSSFRGGGQPGSLAGENIDLVDMVDEIEMTDEEYARLDPVLEAYAIELDPALATRDRAIEDITSLTASVLEGKSEIDDLESKFKSMQRARTQVRDVNDRYVQHLVAHLAPDQAEALQRAYRLRSFRGIYSPTRADGYFETVRQGALLTEPQTGALEMIERDFRNQTDAINRQLADLQKKREIEDQQRIFDRLTMMARGEMGQQRFDRRQGGPGGPFGDNAQDDPRRALMEQKNTLVETTLDSVVALLSPAQLAAAPKPERRQGRGGDREGMNLTDEQRRDLERRIRERRERGGDGGGDRRGGGN